MKLSDILSLKQMGYTDEIKPKHLDKMKRTPSLLQDFPIKNYMGNPPHCNASSNTRIELEELAKLPQNPEFVKEMDDVDKVFKKYLKTVGLDFPEALVEKLLDDSSIIIMKLKYHYNRPRPYQVVDHPLVNVNIGKESMMDSMKTPSYPSGHSTQGILIGKLLSDMYPQHQYNLMSLGRDISDSRNIGRAHYPSDSKFGMKLGYEMFNYLKKTKRV
jgi:hypothetical protein|tara:strand:- start:304 stop:951 length:648 start_codon:yes stop_codon:yes gene_type:complete